MKPMNCPHHTQIYASQPRSYRDLPLRFSEVTTVYRDENTGQLQGLSRVRAITQDDGHAFCRPDQIEEEANKIMDVIERFYAAMGMGLRIRLSTRDPKEPQNYLGSDEVWAKAEGALAGLLKKHGKDYVIGEGEAAFYGPKIDFMIKDAIGREWQLATIQLDFNLPERFGLEFMGDDGQKHRPVMIHRAILGSVERFTSILIEHFAGAFPVWLAPVHVQVIPVGMQFSETSRKFVDMLKAAGIRVGYDEEGGTVGNQVRKAAKQKVPYLVVIGEKEASLEDINVRVRGTDADEPMKAADFIAKVQDKMKTRALEA
jgi:threonyl-tRNA synthetase